MKSGADAYRKITATDSCRVITPGTLSMTVRGLTRSLMCPKRFAPELWDALGYQTINFDLCNYILELYIQNIIWAMYRLQFYTLNFSVLLIQSKQVQHELGYQKHQQFQRSRRPEGPGKPHQLSRLATCACLQGSMAVSLQCKHSGVQHTTENLSMHHRAVPATSSYRVLSAHHAI